MTKRASVVTMMVVVACTLMVAADVAAEGSKSRIRHAGARRAIADHTTAVAALEPVGAAEGWGRVMVKDMALADDGLRRTVAIHLLGLAPETEYAVILDGVEVARPVADLNGDARVRLGSPSDDEPGVPAELPLAADLLEAVVTGPDGPTLQGQFVARAIGFAGPKGLVYMERIELDAPDDGNIRGIARVTRDSDDQQAFETRACGLEPGAAYQIMVDAFDAGTATADEVGHAALELSTAADDGGLLPAGLQPVEDLLQVEWLDDSGTTILIGSFSGTNMVGSGQLRDRQGDGQGEYGGGEGQGGQSGDQGGRHGDGDGSGDGSGEGGPHGEDGDCDGSGQDDGQGGDAS